MENNCYQGVSIPTPIEEPCGGNYTSTDCVSTPSAISYIEVTAGSSQTVINNNLVLALQEANLKIQDLLNRVDILENP